LLDDNFDPTAAQAPDPKPVPLGDRCFQLLFTPPMEALDGFTALRVAQITRDAAGKCMLVDQAVPPCLEFAWNTFLVRLLERRVEKLAAKSRNLAQRRQPTNVGTAGFGTLQDLLVLMTINSFLPGLQHIRSVRFGHPETAYFQLLNLAGALCSFSPLVDPAELPVYDHADAGSRFVELDRIIEMLLEPPTSDRCFSISLQRSGVFWVANLTEERYFAEGEFFLGVRGNMTVPDLIRAAMRSKIGSRDQIEQLHHSFVNGVGLRHETALPAACAAKAGFQYFRLNKTGPFWEEIVASGGIGIYVQNTVVQAEVELLVSLP
jgi:type VI secretion system protein ImpJ